MAAEEHDRIATPDRRVRVFVSSTLGELAPERSAARAAISGLRLTPVMFELGARPHPPRELYRSYLAQSDVFVGIYWQRYGWVAPDESRSGLEDEYLLSGDRPKLMYVKAPAPDRESRLAELLQHVQADDRVSYKPFATEGELGELLADDLAVLLTERFTAPGRSAPAGLRSARLPAPPTALIGREREREGLVALLRGGTRLVTVTGPGGIGKTRLALDVAAAVGEDGFDGVWFVDLAAVAEPARVPAVIAETLGVQAPGSRPVLDVLADQLAGRRVLLVLDNLEHLLPAAGDIGRLLAAAGDLSVLVTSRTVLRLRGEREWPVTPLGLPRADAGPDGIAGSPAVRLFVDRATASSPSFALTASDAAAVAAICRRLDGIPLAIELAAARLRLLTPAALLDRLGSRLDLHGGYADLPDRQRTLRSTLDWSYELLDAGERALLARLAVFAGGWTVEMAEAIGAGGEADVLTTLSSLIDKSLVTVDDGAAAEPRFRMLGVVAEYAAERLDERGERAAALDGLVEVVAGLVGQASAGLRTSHRQWTARLDDELDNVRAAWRHTLAADRAGAAVGIGLPIANYFWSRGMLLEVRGLLDDIAALPSAAALDEASRGWLRWGRAATSIELGRSEGARALLEEAARAGRAGGDGELAVSAVATLSYLAETHEQAQVRATLEQAVAALRARGDVASSAYTLVPLGALIVRCGDLPAGAAAYEECRRLAEEMDNDHLQTLALHQLGFIALLLGDPARAGGYFLASVATNTDLLDQEGLAYCLDGFAVVARAAGQPVAAARLAGAAGHLRTVLGVGVWGLLHPLFAREQQAVRAALGEPRLAAERAAGEELRPEEALAYAREVIERPPPG